MKAVFVELPPFERLRASYLDDDAYKALQNELMLNPQRGMSSKERAVCVSCANPTHDGAKVSAAVCASSTTGG